MSDPIVITDPQILAELEFMKDQCLISEKTYQTFIRKSRIADLPGLEQ